MTNQNLPPSRRGRPARTPEQLNESRRLIINVAKELFLTEGYQGVSMRKIAAKADCLPATLYALFPNKRHILHQLWESVFKELIQTLENTYHHHPQQNRLAALCLAYVDFWLAHPDDYIAIFTIDDRSGSANEDSFIDTFNVTQRLDIFIRTISEAQNYGQVHTGDPIEINNILLCCIQGVTFNLITIPEYPWGNPERLKSETIHTVLNGMKPHHY